VKPASSGRIGIAAAIGMLAWSVASADGPQIESLAARWDGTAALVTYRVTGGLTDDARERIQSGIPVRFRHRIELRSRRAMPIWPSRELGQTTVETQVDYDSLTQQYRLRRDIRVRGAERPEPITEEAVTDSAEEMEAWMTQLVDVRVPPSSGNASGTLRVRVDVTLDRRWVLLVFPSTVDASATTGIVVPD
jgi:Domain of unknown function (DUF4390)